MKAYYDLVNLKTETVLQINGFIWPRILDLGRMYGWQPAGTKFNEKRYKRAEVVAPPWVPKKMKKKFARSMLEQKRRDHEPDDYLEDDQRLITEQDARALAAALRESLDDIPDRLDGSGKKLLTPTEVVETFPPDFVGYVLYAGVVGKHEAPLEALSGFEIPDPALPTQELLGGDEKPKLVKLINHLESGELFIA